MISSPSLSDFGTHDESRYPELWEGCVGAWAPCLGPTGTRLHDFSRFRNWGTLTNMDAATDWVVSDGRYAVDFDGVNDHVNCGTNASPLTTTLSVALFVNWPTSPATTGTMISAFADTFANGWLFLALSNGTVRLDGNAPGGGYTTLASATGIMQPGWQHLCFIRNGGSAFIHRNGIEIANGSFGGSAAFVSNTLYVGQNNFSNYFRGQLDDIRIYNRAPSPAEIRLLATRRGIAYERRKRRSAYVQRTSSLRRKILTGQT